jgi:hypothetical protein
MPSNKKSLDTGQGQTQEMININSIKKRLSPYNINNLKLALDEFDFKLYLFKLALDEFDFKLYLFKLALDEFDFKLYLFKLALDEFDFKLYLFKLNSEWVSDFCLTPNEQFFSYIMARTSYIQWNDDDDDVQFVLDQHAELDFYSASSLKQQSVGRHVSPLRHIILFPSLRSTALEASTLTITPPMRFKLNWRVTAIYFS